MTHDPDGFFTAIDGEETLGFAAAIVRSRQCVLSELWVLPQHQGKGAGELLLDARPGLRRALRGAQLPGPGPARGPIQGLLLRHTFQPLTPVYLLQLSLAAATTLARRGRRLPAARAGHAATSCSQRRGQADLDRIDRVTRGFIREVDHDYWLKKRAFGVAFVRQGIADRGVRLRRAGAGRAGRRRDSGGRAVPRSDGRSAGGRAGRRGTLRGAGPGAFRRGDRGAARRRRPHPGDDAAVRPRRRRRLRPLPARRPQACHDRRPSAAPLQAEPPLPGRLRLRAQRRAAAGGDAPGRADAGRWPAPAPARPAPGLPGLPADRGRRAARPRSCC